MFVPRSTCGAVVVAGFVLVGFSAAGHSGANRDATLAALRPVIHTATAMPLAVSPARGDVHRADDDSDDGHTRDIAPDEDYAEQGQRAERGKDCPIGGMGGRGGSNGSIFGGKGGRGGDGGLGARANGAPGGAGGSFGGGDGGRGGSGGGMCAV